MSLLSSVFPRDVWEKRINRLNEKSPGQFYSMVQNAEPKEISGLDFKFTVETGDPLSAAMTPEGGDFPTPIDGTYTTGVYSAKRITGSVGLTFDEHDRLQRDPGAAVPISQEKTTNIAAYLVRQKARQVYGDGTAVLARCGNTSSSNTVVILNTASSQVDRDDENWLQPGRALIDIVHGTTGAAVATARKIVSRTATTIVIDGAAVSTTSGTHVVTLSGSVAPYSSGTYTSGEFAGLAAALAQSGTYLGLSRSTYDMMRASSLQGGTPGTPEAWKLARLQNIYAQMAQWSKDGVPPSPATGHVLWSNVGVSNSAINALQSAVRYVEPGAEPNYGFTMVQGLGMKWYVDTKYSHNVLDILKMDGIYRTRYADEVVAPMQFLPGTDGIWTLANAASGQGHATKFHAYLTETCGLAVTRPKDHGRLDDIEENGGSN